MDKVYLSATVNKDGTLTIPAYAVRGLGFLPGRQVDLALPAELCDCACGGSELHLQRMCGQAEDFGGDYTTEGCAINLPEEMLERAGIPLGSDISVLSADGMLLIAVSGDGMQEDLTDELTCFMEELGYDPETVEILEAALPF